MRDSKTGRLLNSDDPEREPLTGNVKVTREDWLKVALDVLISDGVEQVKVLQLGERLGVSRSSFYWYFKSRQDLLDALLEHWEATNTAALVSEAEAPAQTITEACCHVFRCAINPALFNVELDFAVRDWARRAGKVRRILDRSDETRLAALTAMFERFGYEPTEAMTRARVLYFMQLGYNSADLGETMNYRLSMVPSYLYVFTGRHPKPSEIEDFSAYARAVEEAGKR